MTRQRPSGVFLQRFSSTVIAQALLSGANLLVGLILLRHQSDTEYGYYVLVTVTLLLVTGLQGAYIGPPMVIRLPRAQAAARAAMVGGLLRAQRSIVAWLAATALVLTGLLWAAGLVDNRLACLMTVAIAAAVLALFREFFRMVLLTHQRAVDVLLADSVYVVLLVAGAYAASYSPRAAASTILALGFAAGIGGGLMARAQWRHERWDMNGSPAVLREIAPVGLWSLAGSGIHWAFSQGYTYLVAAMLDVPAVSAIAATRLLLMPVNLLSNGVCQAVQPMASRWLHWHGASVVYRRLLLLCAALTLAVLCYVGAMWALRDWIFAVVIKKRFSDRDVMLLLWCAVFLCTMLRDLMGSLLMVRGQMRQMTTLTLVCAILALGTSFFAIPALGARGALVGILLGEVVSVIGIAILARNESARPQALAPYVPPL